MAKQERSMLDLLLQSELPQPETGEVKIKRLSKLFGQDFILEFRQISYKEVSELKDMDEFDIQLILRAEINGVLKNQSLVEKYQVHTPAELVKKLFLPGEIADVARYIERLAGFRKLTIEEIEKKSPVTGS